MNIISIERGLRQVGLNSGTPTFFIYPGPGRRRLAEELLVELRDKGINVKMWVSFMRGSLAERDIGSLVKACKDCRLLVEVEADGSVQEPMMWFTSVDRWTVYWQQPTIFNYGALRARQDLLLFEGSMDMLGVFLKDTEKLPAVKGIVTEDPTTMFEVVKDWPVRIYKKEAR